MSDCTNACQTTDRQASYTSTYGSSCADACSTPAKRANSFGGGSQKECQNCCASYWSAGCNPCTGFGC
jgi:hypothetical protein